MGNCFICVPADELVAVERFGKYIDIKQGGLHCLGLDACGICYNTRSISTRVQENQVRCETKTLDDVFVSVTVAVQMEVIPQNAQDAIYRLNNPSQQIDSYVSNVVRARIPKLKLDEVFSSKDEIAAAVQSELAKSMRDFGFFIHCALVTDIDPNAMVKNSMNEINAAKRMREAATDKAEARKIMSVKAAEGEAESKFLQGQGIARQRAAIVDGLKASFGVEGETMDGDKVRELLLITQYFDTLEKMSASPATTIFMPHTIGGLQDVAAEIQKGIISGKVATANLV